MEIKQVVLEHNWLISPEEHLEALASRDPYPLQTFLGVCGVLDLGDLNLDQALMFIVARNIGSRIESLKIFAGKDRSSQNEQWKLKSNTQASVPETEPRFKDSRVPSDNMDFGMIESADELPLIHRDQFLLLDVAPLEFLRRLNSRELSRDVFYERKTDNPENKRNLIDDTTEKLRSDFSIPKAKALLDISSSMNDKDQRGIIARGSQISFMHNAFLSSIELHFRPFNSEVGSLVKGRDADAFHRIVQKLLRLRNDGETSIQRALEQTAKDDIDSKDSVPTRVDILLVTDGQSRIIGRPQGDAVLHTISIGNPLDSCEDPLEKKMAEENHDRLKKISETFIQLTRDDFTALLKPRRLDVLGLYMLIKSVPKELAEVTTQEQAERIYNRIQI
ncbi:MAG: VWA domain-containing protein, partial [Bdellovibrionales bacterium]|nr:VWA domain-containing protein [Bdellovibrionales bacterium]